ncbi:MAG TPA: flagellar hook-length control protein FliK, partial [Solirubrobacter sp.]|nr:flagellar hook-length control protein FliK [Solirubrobacter sp.]
PNLFALQLAGPLPPAPAPVATPATPVAAESVPAAPQALPAFAPAEPPVTGAVPATGQPVAELPQPAAATPPPSLPVLGGLIPASALATEPSLVTEQPAVQVPAQPQPAVEVTPETATPALPNANPGQPQSDAQPQEQPKPPAVAAAPAAPQATPAEAPAPATPAPQPVAAAPATPVTPAPSLERAVPLYRAVETTGTLLHVAAERGVTHARLNLKPAELGGIEVRLQSTPHGVAAKLVADSPEAARMLTQASDDLRRQLAERDVTLLSLDVSTSGEQRHDNTAAGGFGAFDDFSRPSFGSSPQPSAAEPVDAAPAPAETTLVLADGVLVDVLA